METEAGAVETGCRQGMLGQLPNIDMGHYNTFLVEMLN